MADLMLECLEKKALESLGIELPFYVKYTDDIAMAVP